VFVYVYTSVEYEIVPLNEPLGPAATDPELQVCRVSLTLTLTLNPAG